MTRNSPGPIDHAGASRIDARSRRRRIVRYLMVASSAGFAALLNGATAPSNNLGSLRPFGIVSSTYTNTTAGTTVNGGVCFTTGPAVDPVVNGAYGACPAAAGVDQTSALADLNTQPCTTIGSGPLEGISIGGGTPGSFPPGCYVRTGAMDITANGVVTLTGNGVYIFRSSGGALTTGANSRIVLAGGACADNVFWAPVGATTLGASSTFIGNILDAAGVTLGLSATLTGRALAFGGTVTTASNTIAIPAACPAVDTLLIVNKVVINDGGGTLTPAAFSGTIGGAVVATGGNTWAGASTTRSLTTVGAYSVTENAVPGYAATFSADCTGTIAAGETRICTVTNNDTCPVITVNPGTLPNATVGVAYNQTFTGSGGTAPYTFTVTGGALPGGLTLATSGALTGTPTAGGTFTFTVRGTDVNGCFAERTIPLVVTTAVPTLPQAVALLLGLGLTAVGYLRLRRRTRSN